MTTCPARKTKFPSGESDLKIKIVYTVHPPDEHNAEPTEEFAIAPLRGIHPSCETTASRCGNQGDGPEGRLCEACWFRAHVEKLGWGKAVMDDLMWDGRGEQSSTFVLHGSMDVVGIPEIDFWDDLFVWRCLTLSFGEPLKPVHAKLPAEVRDRLRWYFQEGGVPKHVRCFPKLKMSRDEAWRKCSGGRMQGNPWRKCHSENYWTWTATEQAKASQANLGQHRYPTKTKAHRDH